jgi:hypothetical protein
VHTPLVGLSVTAGIGGVKAMSMHVAAASTSESPHTDVDATAAARALAASALAGLLAYGLSQLDGDEYAELRGSVSAKLSELRSMCGLNVDSVECEKLNFDASDRVTSSHPFTPDYKTAHWLRRVLAYVIDQGLIQLLDVLSALVLSSLVFGDSWTRAIEIALHQTYSPIDLLFTFLVVVVWDTTWLTLFNGQTPGKKLFAIRTVRRDWADVSRHTTLDTSTTRAQVCDRPLMSVGCVCVCFVDGCRDRIEVECGSCDPHAANGDRCHSAASAIQSDQTHHRYDIRRCVTCLHGPRHPMRRSCRVVVSVFVLLIDFFCGRSLLCRCVSCRVRVSGDDLTADAQTLHNYLTNTMVINEPEASTSAQAPKEEEEEE